MTKMTSYLIISMSILMLMLVLVAGCTGTKASAVEVKLVPTPTLEPTIVSPTPEPIVITQPQTPIETPTSTQVVTVGPKQTLKISGSTTVLPIVQTAADKYMAVHPEADIQVIGGGSGIGIQAISAKTVDIGMTSREVTAAELKANPDFVITTIAKDGIAIVVNPKNNLQFITLDQAKNLYLGKITKWTEINGAGVANTNNQIVLVGRDSASGTRSYFDETVLLKATPSSYMLEKNSNGAVLQTVAQTPLAVGYISIGFVSNDVKVLPIWYNYDKIITPTIENVKSKTYPISRDLYVVTNGKPTGITKNFIDYILSPDGQKIVSDQGYVTLN